MGRSAVPIQKPAVQHGSLRRRPGRQSGGTDTSRAGRSGEGVMGSAPAAIPNAVFRAPGILLRQIPFAPERVKAALDRLEHEYTPTI